MRQVYTKHFGSFFSVSVVPTLRDNFSYLIHDRTSGTVAAVDANEDIKPIIQCAKDQNLWGAPTNFFDSILVTHKHYDHSGGIFSLKKSLEEGWPRAENASLRIYGGVNDHIQGVTDPVKGGDVLKVGALDVRVIDVPCHTKGHVAYYVFHRDHQEEGAALFTGDTLFIGGIGAFFEGTCEDMCAAMLRLASVNQSNASMDSRTFIFPGHEYTGVFMKFSVGAIPDKDSPDAQFIHEQKSKYEALVKKGMPSVPSSLADEKIQNLFMRAAIDSQFRKLMRKGDTPGELMDYLYNACE